MACLLVSNLTSVLGSCVLASSLVSFAKKECHGGNAELTCPRRSVIHVERVDYSPTVQHSRCPLVDSGDLYSDVDRFARCLTPSVQQSVSSRCDHKNRCVLMVDPRDLGAVHCSHVKYNIEVHFKCFPKAYVERRVCGIEPLRLSCRSDDQVLIIYSAKLGRLSDTSMCNRGSKTKLDFVCEKPGILASVINSCQGRRRCELDAIGLTDARSDACPLIVDQDTTALTATYGCVPKSVMLERRLYIDRSPSDAIITAPDPDPLLAPVTTSPAIGVVPNLVPDWALSTRSNNQQNNRTGGVGVVNKRSSASGTEDGRDTDLPPADPVSMFDWSKLADYLHKHRQRILLFAVTVISFLVIIGLIVIVFKLVYREHVQEKRALFRDDRKRQRSRSRSRSTAAAGGRRSGKDNDDNDNDSGPKGLSVTLRNGKPMLVANGPARRASYRYAHNESSSDVLIEPLKVESYRELQRRAAVENSRHSLNNEPTTPTAMSPGATNLVTAGSNLPLTVLPPPYQQQHAALNGRLSNSRLHGTSANDDVVQQLNHSLLRYEHGSAMAQVMIQQQQQQQRDQQLQSRGWVYEAHRRGAATPTVQLRAWDMTQPTQFAAHHIRQPFAYPSEPLNVFSPATSNLANAITAPAVQALPSSSAQRSSRAPSLTRASASPNRQLNSNHLPPSQLLQPVGVQSAQPIGLYLTNDHNTNINAIQQTADLPTTRPNLLRQHSQPSQSTVFNQFQYHHHHGQPVIVKLPNDANNNSSANSSQFRPQGVIHRQV